MIRTRSAVACERAAWSLLTWRKADFDAATGQLAQGAAPPAFQPFLCGSWRCARCRRWRGAVDWSRASCAILERPWWLYVVLTFDPARWASAEAAYLGAGKCWDEHLRQALRGRAAGFAYLQTWEATRAGWPHVNLLLTGDRLRAWVESLGIARETTTSSMGLARSTLLPRRWRRWLRAAALRSGFGPVVWAEVVAPENGAALAGYLTKLARELVGEGGKDYQTPFEAPKGFRRLRASRGVLPPGPGCRGAGFVTGAVVRRASGIGDAPRRTGERAPGTPTTWGDVLVALTAKAEREALRWSEASGKLRTWPSTSS